MRYPRLAFVEGPSLASAVRLELNDPDAFPGVDPGFDGDEGFTLGVPSISGDPGGFGRQFSYRTLSLPFFVEERNRASAMRFLQLVSRETLRAESWLLFQERASAAPVFARTYLTQGEPLSWESVYDEDDNLTSTWRLDLDRDADPWLLGEEQTHESVTVSNDPAAATNPLRLDVPDPDGDAPARLRVRVDPSQASRMDGYRWCLVSHVDDGRPERLYQLESGWAGGADAAGASSAAGYSGGQRRAVSFADPSEVDRLTYSGGATLATGRYRALVRVGRSSTDLRFGVRATLNGVAGSLVQMAREDSASVGHVTWLDLGEFSHPRFADNPSGEEGGAAVPQIVLSAKKEGGTGLAYFDCLLLLPVNDSTRFLFFDFNRQGAGVPSASGFAVFDGLNERLWGRDSADVIAPVAAQQQGLWPEAAPGETNRLWLFQQTNARGFSGIDSSDDLGASTAVSLSWSPTHVHAGGS